MEKNIANRMNKQFQNGRKNLGTIDPTKGLISPLEEIQFVTKSNNAL